MIARSTFVRAAAASLVSLGMAGAGLLPAHAAAGHKAAHKTPVWLSYNAKTKTANLTVIAAYSNVGGGFNFNGFQRGKMTITVPLNTKVMVTFSNDAALPHSVEFVAFAKTPPVTAPAPVFKGAASANYKAGETKGKTDKFTFVANKAGKYLMICPVPGHAVAGMWDNFVVNAKAKTASISISK
jgi:sulfocyanin